MTMIAKFVDAVDRGLSTFTLQHKNGGVYHFISTLIDGAKFFYVVHSYSDDDSFYLSPENKYELAAIVYNRDFYLFDDYTFERYCGKQDVDYETNRVNWFDDYVKDLHNYYKTTAFKSYMDSIEATQTKEQYVINEAKEKARNCILNAKSFELKCDVKLNAVDAITIMIGRKSIVDVCREHFEAGKEHWEYEKSLKVLVENYMHNDRAAVVEDWEVSMAEALTSLDAKTVTIVGEHDGLTAECKIETEKIMRNLVNKDTFSEWEFPTDKVGKEFIKALGFANHAYRSGFDCGMIQKIIFRKKVIYER